MQFLLWLVPRALQHGVKSLVCLSLVVFPAAIQAQKNSAFITYEASDVKVENVLKEIEKQTSYSLTYNHEEMSSVSVRKVNWKHVPVEEALQELQSRYGIRYSISGDNIALKKSVVVTTQRAGATGKVTGKIIDEETGEALNGVTVKIGAALTMSSIDGIFSVTLPRGKYSADISSVGYGSKHIEAVDVSNDEVFILDISLKKEKGTLKGVVVTTEARRETTASLYVRQKNSAVISDGISAEQIGRTPDKNVGETLKRITGLSTLDNRFLVVRGLSERYNGAMLNGQLMPSTELNRKNFSFDIIPTSMVENITVIKTLTPDLSAEFGGGLVELNTIDIPSRNFLSISAGGGFNDNTSGKPFLSTQLEGKEYMGAVSKHRYLFGSLDWKTGFDAARYYSEHGSKASMFTNNWGVTSMRPQPNQNYQLSFGRNIKLKTGGDLGIVASASYRNNLNRVDIRTGREGWFSSDSGQTTMGARGERYDFVTNLGAMAGIGYRKGNTRISVRTMLLRNLNQQLTLVYKGSGPDGRGNWGYYDLATQSTLWQTQLKGEHQLNKQGLKVNWMASYIYLNKLRPDNHVLLAEVPENEQAPDINDITIRYPAAYYGFVRWWSRALEKNTTWDASVSVPFQVAGSRQTFKGGYAGWNKDRLFYVLNAGQSTGAGQDGFYVPLTSAFGPEYSNAAGFTKYGDSMHKAQSLHAVYAMLDNRFGAKWRLVWGLRAEYLDIGKLNGFLDHLESESHVDLTNWRKREPAWHFFPSANLTYALHPKMNLRLAYARSIIRPDLREMAYFHEYDYELGGEYGGAAIRSTIIDNYDFRYEWYPSVGDVISFTAFYKKLNYPLEIFQQPNRLFELKNSKEARNQGIEIEARKSLAFTQAPVIRNLTLYGNFTYLDGKVRPMTIKAVTDSAHPNRSSPVEEVYDWEKRPQAGAGTYIFNAGLFYDTRLVSISALYNALTNRLVRVTERFGGQSTSYLSFYERPAKTLDLQLGLHLMNRSLDLKMSVSNVLNSSYIVYSNRDQPDANNNITKKQMEYKEGLDLVDYKSTNGRTYSFTLTYTIK